MAADRSTETDSPSEAGWYDDPTSPRKERLWDGSRWLEWSRPRKDEDVETDPAGWRPDPSNPDRERLWSGDQWTESVRDTGEGQKGRVQNNDNPGERKFGVPLWIRLVVILLVDPLLVVVARVAVGLQGYTGDSGSGSGFQTRPIGIASLFLAGVLTWTVLRSRLPGTLHIAVILLGFVFLGVSILAIFP